MHITRAQALRGGFAALVAACAAPAFADPAPGGAVNGRTVTAVSTPSGSFVQLTGRRWEERGRDGGRFSFEESHRDDWSVYLIDRSRGVRLQLDLYTRKVTYADTDAPNMRDLYPITGSSAQVSGWNVTSVSYPQGGFRMTGPGRWDESGDNGGRFTFTETKRDAWSVYLIDRSRNVEIQLDLWRRMILYNEVGQARSPLYDVTGSSAF